MTNQRFFLGAPRVSQPKPSVRVWTLALGSLTLGLAMPSSALADESCRKVRMSDVGWTDITVTTAVAAELLKDLGYESKIEFLSVPVTFTSLKNGDIDVFLGNWMPTQAADIKPYLDDGSVVQIRANLDDALFTLAVPKYVSEAGVKSPEDLAKHADKFKKKIHGIEPGNDGNRIILDLIKNNTYGMGKFSLVESSEQGMLGEVQRAVANKEWIVFLGWKPHPMNVTIDMAYLTDPLEKWGPGGGLSIVHTVANKAFRDRCPSVMKLFENMKFTIAAENMMMGEVLDKKRDAAIVAREWITAHPTEVAVWKKDVPAYKAPEKVAEVKPASSAEAAAPPPEPNNPPPVVSDKPSGKIPLGAWLSSATKSVTTHLATPLRALSTGFGWLMDLAVRGLLAIPPLVMIALFTGAAHVFRRRVGLTAAVAGGSLLVWNLGFWNATIETLVLVVLATAISVFIGVPIGIAAAHRPRWHAALLLILDLMQTIPTFVYLIPALMLFGLGIVPGLVATVIFAMPASIRLTYLGISSVPREMIEAVEAFGATPDQVLRTVELPYARKAIMEGVSQALMLSLSMVVIAALVGAGGLGTSVVRALNNVDIGQGFEAGLVIVILAVLLDRSFHGPAVPLRAGGKAP